MYDPTDRLYSNERATERGYDLNRETAAECDGITPANVPVWSALRVENMDGTTNINATINAICTHVRTLNEAAADTIREIEADREAANDIAAQYAIENEGLRERVTNAETLLNSSRWTTAAEREELRRTMFSRPDTANKLDMVLIDLAFGTDNEAPAQRAA